MSCRLTRDDLYRYVFDLLEENDDIQKVYSNFDIDQQLLEKIAG